MQQKKMGLSITMDDARKVVEAMLKAAIDTAEDPNNPNANAPMGFAVTDTAGIPVYFTRMDGASAITWSMAQNKAYTAIVMRRDTIESDNGLKKTGRDIAMFQGGEPRLTYVPGGVLLRSKDGLIVGAVGTSGRSAIGPMGDEELARIGPEAYSNL